MLHKPLRADPAPRLWALIPAAGRGQRALNPASALPKQYQSLLGKSLLSHTLEAFACVAPLAGCVVVIAPEDRLFAAMPEHAAHPATVHAVGGASRAESVRNGVRALQQAHGAQPHDWVLVHDAARCLITPELIERLIQACSGDAVGGLLALPLPDTLKEQQPSDGGPPRAGATVARDGKWLAHTPQMFRLQALADALDAAELATINDEASAIEAAGLSPLLVPSSAQNFKITYPEDFALAEAVLRARQAKTDSQP